MERPKIEEYRIKGRATFDHDSYDYDMEVYANQAEDEIADGNELIGKQEIEINKLRATLEYVVAQHNAGNLDAISSQDEETFEINNGIITLRI